MEIRTENTDNVIKSYAIVSETNHCVVVCLDLNEKYAPLAFYANKVYVGTASVSIEDFHNEVLSFGESTENVTLICFLHSEHVNRAVQASKVVRKTDKKILQEYYKLMHWQYPDPIIEDIFLNAVRKARQDEPRINCGAHYADYIDICDDDDDMDSYYGEDYPWF